MQIEPGQDSELADILDELGNPRAVTIKDILNIAKYSETGKKLAEWLDEPKNQRIVPVKMRDCEYEAIKKPGRKDGFWIVNGKRRVVYAKLNLTFGDQLEAAEERAQGGAKPGIPRRSRQSPVRPLPTLQPL
jgi:hypothetical protein